jgi:hypothetical protein
MLLFDLFDYIVEDDAAFREGSNKYFGSFDFLEYF